MGICFNFLISPAEHAQEPVRRLEAVPRVEEVSGLRLAQAVIAGKVVVVLNGKKKTLKSKVKSNIFFSFFSPVSWQRPRASRRCPPPGGLSSRAACRPGRPCGGRSCGPARGLPEKKLKKNTYILELGNRSVVFNSAGTWLGSKRKAKGGM